MFDPYRKWLGIPEQHRPPSHYQLLAISPDEQDREVIEAAVIRQSVYVRNFQSGPNGEFATQILTELAAAKACLLDPAKRAAYDASLRPAAGNRAAAPAPTNASGSKSSESKSADGASQDAESASGARQGPGSTRRNPDAPETRPSRRAEDETPRDGRPRDPAEPRRSSRHSGGSRERRPSSGRSRGASRPRAADMGLAPRPKDPLANLLAASSVDAHLARVRRNRSAVNVRITSYVIGGSLVLGGMLLAILLIPQGSPPSRIVVTAGDGHAAGSGPNKSGSTSKRGDVSPAGRSQSTIRRVIKKPSVAPAADDDAPLADSQTMDTPIADAPAAEAPAEPPAGAPPEMAQPATPQTARSNEQPGAQPAPNAATGAPDAITSLPEMGSVPPPAPRDSLIFDPSLPPADPLPALPKPGREAAPAKSGTPAFVPKSLNDIAPESERDTITTSETNRTFGEIRCLNSARTQFTSLAFSPSGNWVAAGGQRGRVWLWSMIDPQLAAMVAAPRDAAASAVTCLAFTPDEENLLVGSSSGLVRCISLTDDDHNELSQFAGHTAQVNRVSVFAGGAKAISCGNDSAVRVWTVADGVQLNSFTNFTGGVDCLRMVANSVKFVASDGMIADIGEAMSPKPLRTVPFSATKLETAASPDGRYLIGGGQGAITVVDLKTRLSKPVLDDTAAYDRFEFSPDGRLLVALVKTSNMVSILDFATRDRVVAFEGHTASPQAAQFSPDGRLVVTSASDGSVRIWQLPPTLIRGPRAATGGAKSKKD